MKNQIDITKLPLHEAKPLLIKLIAEAAKDLAELVAEEVAGKTTLTNLIIGVRLNKTILEQELARVEEAIKKLN
jgi:hypothetical protein